MKVRSCPHVGSLHVAARFALASASLTLFACGGAQGDAMRQPAKAPEARAHEPSTVEEAQDQIARARAELSGASGGGSPSSLLPPGEVADSSRRAPEAAPAQPPLQATARPSTADSASASKAAVGASNHCANPCRALASMRRAVAALCRMTGDDDGRCTEARRTLADSEGLIAPCSC